MARARVEPAAAGQRVDHLVATAIPSLSVAAARRLVADGAVRIDGRRARKGERLAAGQTLDIDDAALGATQPAPVAPDPTVAVDVVYADDALVAIAKPAGVPSHPLRPGQLGTAANALVARFPECAAASPDPREAGLANRLDSGTSGLLVAARRPDVWPRLRAALTGPDCEKTYLAEVAGAPPNAGQSTDPIGRVGRRAGRVRVGGGRRPQEARTDWELVERRDSTAVVRARLHSGRPHQVRAHLAAAGFPIVGDATYGGPKAPELRLHAAAIRLRHPISGDLISLEAGRPPWAKMGR
jgi:23S rRNA pseudouridine1911/1915/1917 synthase